MNDDPSPDPNYWKSEPLPTDADLDAMLGNWPRTWRCGFVYLAYSQEVELYKIGFSRNVARRIIDLKREFWPDVEIIHWFIHHNAFDMEHHLHEHYYRGHVAREWFKLSPFDLWAFQRLAAAYGVQHDIELEYYRG